MLQQQDLSWKQPGVTLPSYGHYDSSRAGLVRLAAVSQCVKWDMGTEKKAMCEENTFLNWAGTESEGAFMRTPFIISLHQVQKVTWSTLY